MKYITTIIITTLLIASCKKDDDSGANSNGSGTDYHYHAHIISPDNSQKMMNDTLDISVHFESHEGETVHNIQVRLYDAADNTELYNMPTNTNVAATSGTYHFSDQIVMNMANGFMMHHDYILEAKVWGASTGDGEEIETVQFHLHHM